MEDTPIHRATRRICGLPRSSHSNTTIKPPKCYKKVFAILMMIEKPGRISRFVEGVCDADLPLLKRLRSKPGKPFTLVRDDSEGKNLSASRPGSSRQSKN